MNPSPDLLLAIAIPTITTAVGFGMLRQQVKSHDKALDGKASSERVDALRESIQVTHESVRRLEEKFDRFLERGGA